MLAKLCLVLPKTSLTFFAAGTSCWLMFNSVLTRKLRHFLPSFFPTMWQPANVGAWSCSSSCISPFWTSGWSYQPISPAYWGPSEVSATPGFVSSAKLLRVQSAPSYKSLMKVLNRTGLSRDFWSYTASFWPLTRTFEDFNYFEDSVVIQTVFSLSVKTMCI